MVHCAKNQAAAWRIRVIAGLTIICAAASHSALAQSVPDQGLQGFRIMSNGSLGNCIACHAIPGQSGIVSTFGPALDKVASRYSPDELRQWVSDARKFNPSTLMPPFATTQGTNQSVRVQAMLTEEQIALVVAALLTLK